MYDNDGKENINNIVNNFNSFFDKLSEEFTPKDAYLIYLEKALSAINPVEGIEYMKKSVTEGRKYISDKSFEENKGRLWLHKDGRPYMKSKYYLAHLYKNHGDIDLCINEYKELLRLDTYDHLNIKSELAPLLLNENRYDEFYMLMEFYRRNESLAMLYSKSLYYFCKKDDINSKRFIKKSFYSNLYVPEYLLLIKKWEVDEESSKKEILAIEYSEQSMKGWAKEKALYWLMNEYFAYCSKYDIDLDVSKEFVTERLESFYEQFNDMQEK